MSDDAPCLGCGGRIEVYGSSWCPRCPNDLPLYVRDRLLQLRNGLIDARYARTRKDANRFMDAALERPEAKT